MARAQFDVRPINLRDANDAEYASLAALKNAMRREALPEDPPWPADEQTRHFQGMPAIQDDTAWVASRGAPEDIVALAQADIFQTGDNPRVLWFEVGVLPDFRRQGLGRLMLRQLAAHARSRGRTLLTVECHDRAPAGPAFLERIGARPGLVEAMNQVRIADLDRGLIDSWLSLRPTLSAEFELGFWYSPYPSERLQDLADLLQRVANDQPRDTLQMEDFNYSPDVMRQFDNQQRLRGDQRWTLYASHRPDGRLAGITEVFWNSNRPHILLQGFTGVMPVFRGRGLGRWIKAEMLARVLRDRPQVQVIRAGNADSNAPMLKINRTLGFQRSVAWTTWQVELEQVETYLASRA
jgi:mycothiol synthase